MLFGGQKKYFLPCSAFASLAYVVGVSYPCFVALIGALMDALLQDSRRVLRTRSS